VKSNSDEIFKIVGIYLAMIVGAGFASGQELMQFFVKYGKQGLYGVAAAAVLFAAVGYAVMRICAVKGIASNTGLITHLFGEHFGAIIEIFISFVFLAFYFAMVAATGAAVKQVYAASFSAGAFVISFLVFLVLLLDIGGVMKLNAVLSPVIFFGGAVTGIYILASQNSQAFANGSLSIAGLKDFWLTSALIYVSYNIAASISLLAAASGTITSKKSARAGSLAAAFALAVLGICMAAPLLNDLEFVKEFEIPFLALVNKYNSAVEYIYLTVLLCSIFTTAVGNAFAFVSFVRERTGFDPLLIKAALCAVGFFASNIGFSVFVGKIYPIFGIVGLLEIIVVAFAYFRLRRV
jgi:uncharacterized membrane protein YkvI